MHVSVTVTITGMLDHVAVLLSVPVMVTNDTNVTPLRTVTSDTNVTPLLTVTNDTNVTPLLMVTLASLSQSIEVKVGKNLMVRVAEYVKHSQSCALIPAG